MLSMDSMDAQDDRGPAQDDAFCSDGCISLTSLGMAGISGGFASVHLKVSPSLTTSSDLSQDHCHRI